MVTVAGAMALLGAGSARAEQIVLFDITYTHTNANDSHHGISGAALNQPDNWTAPINYAQGTIHFYQEVMTKPSDKPTIIDFCLISARGYGCIETLVYTKIGLNETMRSMAGGDVDQRARIDFTRKMSSIQMVLKTPAPTFINGGRPQSDFLPSKMRFVATRVSPGGTYIKPKPTPGFDPGTGAMTDGGATMEPADAGAPTPAADAAEPTAEPDAGGSTPTTPSPDAGSKPADPKPMVKLDAGSKPADPKPTPEPEDPEPEPARRATGGCAVGSGGVTGGLGALVVLGLAVMSVRRRRRR
jgi:hypothetical protein